MRFTPAAGTTTTPDPIWPSWRISGWASSAPARPLFSAFRTWRDRWKHLLVFQRTPSTVDVRGNRPTDPAWSADLEEGWQRRRIENFQLLTAGGEADEDLVNDAWTSIVKKLFVMRQTSIAGMSDEERLRAADLADFAKMEDIRARVDSIVTDRATAEALKPWYGYFCKRPCFHDEYLQTFNRDNVTLVDTQGRGRRADHGRRCRGRRHGTRVSTA